MILITSYVAGILSGVALIVALIFLEESNPVVLKRREMEKEGEKEKKEVLPLKKKTVRPKVTGLMVCCFAFEFCNRWAINAFDSRYGFYLMDRYNAPADHFSYFFLSFFNK